MLKSFLKNTALWIKISYSLGYQKFRNPGNYRKQIEELDFYRSVLKELDNDLIFDVGANIGNKSYLFSTIANKVLAFEPSEKCLHILKSRFEKSSVQIFDIALSSVKATSDYYEIQDNVAYSSLSKKHIDTTVKGRNIPGADSIQSKRIETDTLENFIIEYGKPSYIKIDVEGYELEVIKGLKSVVPLVSFESNLPEFLKETMDIIEYLSELSRDKYVYNICTDTSFLFENYIAKDAIIEFLESTQLRYLEIYSKIDSN